MKLIKITGYISYFIVSEFKGFLNKIITENKIFKKNNIKKKAITWILASDLNELEKSSELKIPNINNEIKE